MISNIGSVWKSGALEYVHTPSNDVVDVAAPFKLFRDFQGKAVDTTNDLNFQGTNSGAVAVNAVAGGSARMTTGGTSGNDCQLSSGLVFRQGNTSVMECKIAAADVAASAWCVGFSDAVAESAGSIAVSISGTTITTTASDGIFAFYDSAATTDAIRAIGVDSDTDTESAVWSGTHANDVAVHLRFELTSAGRGRVFVNHEKLLDVALDVGTVPLCAYFGAATRASAAKNFDGRYIRAWMPEA